jgi:hypothetical protein
MSDGLIESFRHFSTAPPTQLDEKGARECADFIARYDAGEDVDSIRFARNLRDKCVRYSWSSGFVIQVLSAMLTDHPETDEEAEARRAEILAEE